MVDRLHGIGRDRKGGTAVRHSRRSRHASSFGRCLALIILLAVPHVRHNGHPLPDAPALNRLLFERYELKPPPPSTVDGGAARHVAVLPLVDPRATHVARVLQLRDGDIARVGVLDGGIDDAAKVRWIWPEGSVGKWTDNESRESRPERLELHDITNALGREKELPEALELTFAEGSEGCLGAPRVDLVLAPPQPKRLENLLPQISQLGVGSVTLCGASGIDSRTFGVHWLKQPAGLRALLVKGLVQSGETLVPKAVIAPRLEKFLRGARGATPTIDDVAPLGRTLRVVAVAGQGGPGAALMLRFSQLEPPSGCPLAQARLLVAVGPESGWSQGELDSLLQVGFRPVSLGPRALESEAATCAALALAASTTRRWSSMR